MAENPSGLEALDGAEPVVPEPVVRTYDPRNIIIDSPEQKAAREAAGLVPLEIDE